MRATMVRHVSGTGHSGSPVDHSRPPTAGTARLPEHRTMGRWRAILAVIACLALIGCGGGATAGTPAPTAVPAVDAACAEAFADLTDAYDRIKFSALSQSCITLIGKPEEDALNGYVRAYNKWNDCIKKTGCDTDSITPALQAEWTKATALLKDVKAQLP